jgi:hypothetical protein
LFYTNDELENGFVATSWNLLKCFNFLVIHFNITLDLSLRKNK